MMRVHGRCGNAIDLGAAPAGREDTRITVIEDVVVDVGEGRKLRIRAVVHVNHRRIDVAAEAVRHGGCPLEIHGAFAVTARRRSVDIELLVVIGQIGVLALETDEIVRVLGAGRGDGNGCLRRRDARIVQRIAAVALRVERVGVVRFGTEDILRIVDPVGLLGVSFVAAPLGDFPRGFEPLPD